MFQSHLYIELQWGQLWFFLLLLSSLISPSVNKKLTVFQIIRERVCHIRQDIRIWTTPVCRIATVRYFTLILIFVALACFLVPTFHSVCVRPFVEAVVTYGFPIRGDCTQCA